MSASHEKLIFLLFAAATFVPARTIGFTIRKFGFGDKLFYFVSLVAAGVIEYIGIMTNSLATALIGATFLCFSYKSQIYNEYVAAKMENDTIVVGILAPPAAIVFLDTGQISKISSSHSILQLASHR